MVSFNARITAYDCIDQVVWTVKLWDFDSPPSDWEAISWAKTGTMRGRGSEEASKWLRELLEDIREHM